MGGSSNALRASLGSNLAVLFGPEPFSLGLRLISIREEPVYVLKGRLKGNLYIFGYTSDRIRYSRYFNN